MDPNKDDPSKNNPDPSNDPANDPKDKKDPPAKTFTQEDFDNQLKKTLAEKEAKLEKKFEERLAKELEERERKAKLSAEEREAEERKKREAEVEQERTRLSKWQNELEAKTILQEKKISTELVDFVVDVDADKTKENIDKLETAFLKAVEAGVNDRLKGQTPTDKSTKSTQNAPKSTGATRVL